VPLYHVDIRDNNPAVRHYPQDTAALALVTARDHHYVITFSDSLHGRSYEPIS
jgi:hypothetical protein